MNDIKQTQTLVLIAMMTALVTAVTMMFRIPLPIGGYINLGDVVVMSAVLVLPIRGALIAASVGSALADILSSYAHYAVFTFFIKALEAWVVFKLLNKKTQKRQVVPFVMGALVMMIGYGLVDGFLAGEAAVILSSMLYNSAQALASAVIIILLYPHILRLKKHLRG